MPAWTIQDVREVAPEFTEVLVDDSIVTSWITRAARRLSEPAWGDSAKDAGAYLTAHMMAMAGLGPFAGQNHTGAVTSTIVGQVQVTYSTMQYLLKLDPSLGLTRFGLMYASLHNEQCFGIAVL